LLEEGAGDMSAQEFQTRLEDLAASIRFRASDDVISISARFLTENKEEVVELLRQALIAPRFDQEALDRVRAQVLSGIASDAKDPNAISSAVFNAAAYGDHPYGSAREGTAESVSALTRDDMIEAHRNALVRDRLYVSVVGDTTAEAIGSLLDELLGDLPQEGPPLPANVTYDLDGGITIVDFATPQSVALLGQGGMKRDDEDFFAAVIVNRVLGAGGFESRLMTEVREKRGLTYGIRSYLVPRFHSEVMLGSVASSNETIAEAIEVTRNEWARMANEGMTAEELEVAKTYMTGEYPLRFDGNAEIAKIMVGMQMVGLTPDYVTNRNDFVEAVTLEDVNRVAAELLEPDKLRFVVVGKPVGLESIQ
ncbi:MAG: pitrilysin family protein, partial [Pseudomonadota bacterium]